jgi:AcrR family transcriptional regulator
MSELELKSKIVESATLYFSKYGFYKTTMNEIARHIHKAKGLIYYYFKSKEELFNEVLKYELNSVKAELINIVNSDKDSLVIINQYMLTRLKLLHQAVNYHETLKADFFEKFHFVKDVRSEFDLFERNQLAIILNKGKKEGFLEVKNVDSTVNIIMMIMNGIEIPLFLQNKYSEYEEAFEELAVMIVDSLRNRKK